MRPLGALAWALLPFRGDGALCEGAACDAMVQGAPFLGLFGWGRFEGTKQQQKGHILSILGFSVSDL